LSDSRRLAALMFTDMVGYSAMAFRDERVARELVAEQRQIVREQLIKYHGREHQTTGDGFFIEFSSAVDAVQCAVMIQMALEDRDRHSPSDRQLKIRIGIHLGDIVESGPDLYGNNVNLAARIEPLAPAGGVCITSHVYEQVYNKLPAIEFRKVGKRQLKNIESGAQIFRVVMPWEKSKNYGSPVSQVLKKNLPSWNTRFVATLFTVVVGLLLWVFNGVLDGASSLKPKREPASIITEEPAPKMDLAKGWTYKTSDDPSWKEFDTRSSWRYADEIHGEYWLKKTFSSAFSAKEPAILLGLVSDSHRTYVNGNFVGGADRYEDLAFYSFDKSLLKTDGDNTILVHAFTRPSLNPGLIYLPITGSFAGEFSDVRQAVMRDQIRFQVLQSIYLTICIIMFLVCFGYACFSRSSLTYFYCAMILLLGAAHSAYYNPWVADVCSYAVLRYLKVLALGITPMIVCSAYLHGRNKFRLEFANNILTLFAVCANALALLVLPAKPSAFTLNYNWSLALAIVYSFLSISAALVSTLRTRNAKATNAIFTLEGAYLFMALLGVSSLIAALKMGALGNLISDDVRSFMLDLSLIAPFLFSLYVTVVSTGDHVRKSRLAKMKQDRDTLMLELIHLMRNSRDPYETLTQVQDLMCSFLKALRSTLYVFEGDEKEPVLTATYATGERNGHFEVRKSVRPDEGIIGYAFQNRTPLLISDIRKDPRFFGPQAKFRVEGYASYKSGSCMIFPLSSGTRLVGVLTLADKHTDYQFTKTDFEVGLEVSSILAVLLDNRNMQQELAGHAAAG
jgi:class 3 adenylate cyclase